MIITVSDQKKILEEFFNALALADQQKIFAAGFRRAAKPLTSKAKSNAPRRSGRLEKSIGPIYLKNEIAVVVGARRGGANKGYHGMLVERGTRERIRKNGASTGRMKGQFWFEKAYNSTSGIMDDEISQEWYHAIDRLIIRTNKKAERARK